MTAIYDIASDYVDQIAALDPIAATAIGVPGHDSEMTDFSPEGVAAHSALRRATLAKLAAAEVTGDRDRVAKEAMEDVLSLREELVAAGDQYRLSGFRNATTTMRMSFDLMPRATEEDWRNIAARLALIPWGAETFRVSLEEGLRIGAASARRQVAQAIKQSATYAGADGSKSFFHGLLDAFDASGIPSPGLRSDIEKGADVAAAAYSGFSSYLSEKFMDRAVEKDGVGRELYQLSSRVYNGVELDLEETYRWGWDELYRIESEMLGTCAKILPGASIEETKLFLESDPNRAIDGVEEFRQWMQDLQDRTIAEMDGVHFDIPGPLRKIEAMIAPPGGSLAMYYTSPSEDFSRPGRTWYPTGGKSRFPLWGEVSIAYHEGVPGHHFERATAKYLAAELSRFQRLMGGTSGYVEGWALYAERLMGELGYLENPDYYLGMLRAQAMRAVRVIVDIGMHLDLRIPASEAFHGGETWNAGLGQEFCLQRSQFPPDFMQSEVIRYLGTPGQAISYKVGERCWLEAREASKKRLGEAFSLRDWHRDALNLGPMGLAQMQRELARI
ncbi:MAG: DUF885 domain-containing protein [Dehalococcoidia bacterium]|nr:DUF885 domain-containing protein [Dehalococcoidia bacterium]